MELDRTPKQRKENKCTSIEYGLDFDLLFKNLKRQKKTTTKAVCKLVATKKINSFQIPTTCYN